MKIRNSQADDKHVVVVGAGIVGIGAAIWLLRDGHRVTIVDAKGPAEGTSFGNAGILANSSIVPVTSPCLIMKAPGMLFSRSGPLFLKWSYLPRLLPWLRRYLSHCNVEAVERIAAALMPIIGDSVDQHLAIARGTPAERFITPVDYTYAYANREAYLADALAWRIRREHGFIANELDTAALREAEPNLGPNWRYGVQLPGHAWIRDPGAYIKALCAHAQSQGAVLKIETVDDFEFDGERLRAVVTGNGRIDCDEVVIAAGAWSARLCARLGLKVALTYWPPPVSNPPLVKVLDKLLRIWSRVNSTHRVRGIQLMYQSSSSMDGGRAMGFEFSSVMLARSTAKK